MVPRRKVLFRCLRLSYFAQPTIYRHTPAVLSSDDRRCRLPTSFRRLQGQKVERVSSRQKGDERGSSLNLTSSGQKCGVQSMRKRAMKFWRGTSTNDLVVSRKVRASSKINTTLLIHLSVVKRNDSNASFNRFIKIHPSWSQRRSS